MTTPLWHLTLPDSDGPEHFAPLQIALEGMAKVNEWHIARALKQTQKGIGIPIPPLYASGVRYQEDPPGHEDWRDCLAVLRRGIGDCDQVVAWRVAELRVNGTPAEPVLKWQWIPREMMLYLYGRDDRGNYNHDRAVQIVTKMIGKAAGCWMVHCLVRFPDGSIEDPSKILGMGGSFTNKV